MEKLRPSLWRTCRVLANESRLKLLWRLLQEGEMSMTQLAQSVGLSTSNASRHLRALGARGLIKAEQRGLFVFYSVEANVEVDHAPELLEALRACYLDAIPYHRIIRLATAFTHPRRITIVKALIGMEMTEAALSIKSRIPPQSLYRHVAKLERRGFVKKTKEIVCLIEEQEMPLERVLLGAALR